MTEAREEAGDCVEAMIMVDLYVLRAWWCFDCFISAGRHLTQRAIFWGSTK
jgi:hypothetical protein